MRKPISDRKSGIEKLRKQTTKSPWNYCEVINSFHGYTWAVAGLLNLTASFNLHFFIFYTMTEIKCYRFMRSIPDSATIFKLTCSFLYYTTINPRWKCRFSSRNKCCDFLSDHDTVHWILYWQWRQDSGTVQAGALKCGLLPDRRILKNGNYQICMSGSVKADDMNTCYRHHNNFMG